MPDPTVTVPPEIVANAAKAVMRTAWWTPPNIAETVLAAVYGDIVEAARRDAPCPTCQGRNRATTDMVCMTCGRDYMPDDGSDETEPGLGWLRLLGAWRALAKQTEAERDAALALHRDAMATMTAEVERLRERSVGLRAAELAYDEARAENVRLRADLADRDRAVRDARRDALDQAVEAIEADAHKVEGMRRAARIVAGLRDSEATG